MPEQWPMTIGGRPIAGDARFQVTDPATEKVVGLAPDANEQQIDLAMRTAQAAFNSWRNTSDRGAYLRRAAEVLEGSVDTLAELLTREQGKPIANARGEVSAAAMWFRYYSEFEIGAEIIRDDSTALVEVFRPPLGVVVAITPWNAPLMLAAWKIAPALHAGNAVVVKPSPDTPLSTLAMIEILNEVFPAGVLNSVSGTDRIGPLLTAHSIPRKISFTGSVETGRAVGMAALRDFKRLTLELGGNDPAIVLDDADVDTIADRLFWAAFLNAGQVCAAIKRVYVPRSISSGLVDALAERAQSVVLGHGLDPQTQMGPLTNEQQQRKVADLVEDARRAGARIVTGGSAVPGAGHFYMPTIVHAAGGTRLVKEEQFGPALPVVTYDALDDVVAEVNAGPLALGASVWGEDSGRLRSVASKIDSGTVWINSHGPVTPDQPFGGRKFSGLGVEHGRWGFESYTDVRVVHTLKRNQT